MIAKVLKVRTLTRRSHVAGITETEEDLSPMYSIQKRIILEEEENSMMIGDLQTYVLPELLWQEPSTFFRKFKQIMAQKPEFTSRERIDK